MVFIKYVCRVPLRMSDAMLEVGDFAIHGEEPYTFAHYNRSLLPGAGVNNGDTRGRAGDEENGSSDGSGVIMGTDPHARKVEEIKEGGPSMKRD